MEKFYVISGLNPELDGFYLQGEIVLDMLHVKKILNGPSMAFSIPEDALYIDLQYVREAPDFVETPLSVKNNYGKFLYEGTMEVSGLKVAFAQFEKVLQVSVIEVVGNKTLYSENFSSKIDEIKEEIENMLKSGSDIHDLIFRLRDFKELEDGETKERSE